MEIQIPKNRKIAIFGAGSDLALSAIAEISKDIDVYAFSREDADVRNYSDVERCLKLENFDVVANFAGTLYSSTFMESDPERWRNDLEVNALGCYNIARNTFNINSKSRFITVSSTAAFNSYHDWTSYCIGKAAQVKIVFGLIEAGYNASCFCPGAIDTKFRNGLNINNSNVMTVDQGISPIVGHIRDERSAPGIYMYRLGSKIIKVENERI